jgi:uncharacterized protein YcbX
MTVTALSVAAVKATRLRPVQRIELDELGARGNRAFHVIDDRGRMVNGKRIGDLTKVVADYDVESGRLGLAFPDGTSAVGQVRYGETVSARFFSHEISARELVGPWDEALSSFFGQPLRLASAEIAVDRGRSGAVSLISRGSLRRLAEANGDDSIDARRFRMLVEIDGVAAHEEDRWVRRRVRIGSALVVMQGHVGRCLVTSRDPDTGEVNLPTLDMLAGYRRHLDTTEPLPFGIYGAVLEPGSVSVGDAVALEG